MTLSNSTQPVAVSKSALALVFVLIFQCQPALGQLQSMDFGYGIDGFMPNNGTAYQLSEFEIPFSPTSESTDFSLESSFQYPVFPEGTMQGRLEISVIYLLQPGSGFAVVRGYGSAAVSPNSPPNTSVRITINPSGIGMSGTVANQSAFTTLAVTRAGATEYDPPVFVDSVSTSGILNPGDFFGFGNSEWPEDLYSNLTFAGQTERCYVDVVLLYSVSATGLLPGATEDEPLPPVPTAYRGRQFTQASVDADFDDDETFEPNGAINGRNLWSPPVVENGYGNSDEVYLVGETGLSLLGTTTPAFGYGFTLVEDIGFEASNRFRTFRMPDALPGGQSELVIMVAGESYPLTTGTEFDFRTIDPTGVPSFLLTGIDEAEGLDAAATAPFLFTMTFMEEGVPQVYSYGLPYVPDSVVFPDSREIVEGSIEFLDDQGELNYAEGFSLDVSDGFTGQTVMKISGTSPTNDSSQHVRDG